MLTFFKPKKNKVVEEKPKKKNVPKHNDCLSDDHKACLQRILAVTNHSHDMFRYNPLDQ